MPLLRRAALRWPRLLVASAASARSTRLDAGFRLLPDPEKAARGGEDACFTLPRVFGVFDGVGGWARHGVDPGRFSRGFASGTAAALEADPGAAAGEADLTAALTTALSESRRREVGTSTACVMQICANAGVFFSQT